MCLPWNKVFMAFSGGFQLFGTVLYQNQILTTITHAAARCIAKADNGCQKLVAETSFVPATNIVCYFHDGADRIQRNK